jgi:hypothetical protein
MKTCHVHHSVTSGGWSSYAVLHSPIIGRDVLGSLYRDFKPSGKLPVYPGNASWISLIDIPTPSVAR